MLISIVLFILVFSLVVLVHELGHLWVARRLGIAVEEFSLGLPPRLWRWQAQDLTISLGSIPIGGYVRLRGNGGQSSDPAALENRSPWEKAAVAVAGVVMNLILAYLIFFFGFLGGLPPLYSTIQTLPTAWAEKEMVQIIGVRGESPAEKAGLKAGDYIIEIGNQAVLEPQEVSEITGSSLGKKLNLKIKRSEEELSLEAQPEMIEGRSSLGVILEKAILKAHYAWWAVPYLALLETGRVTGAIGSSLVRVIGQFLVQGEAPAELTGPVGIARLTGEAANLGFFQFLHFIVLLTVNLALLNLLPLPALDGGRLMIAIGEGLVRRRLKPSFENAIHLVGFLLLMALVVFVTYRDIVRFF